MLLAKHGVTITHPIPVVPMATVNRVMMETFCEGVEGAVGIQAFNELGWKGSAIHKAYFAAHRLRETAAEGGFLRGVGATEPRYDFGFSSRG